MELPLVEALALAEREQVEGVVVARDEHEPRADVPPVDREALPAPPVLHCQRQCPQAGQGVPPAAVVLTAVHEPRVDPERDVVEKEAVVRAPHVDSPLDTVVECGQRGDRIVAVEPEVAREVIPRPERDADERDLLLDRDLGDGGERPVAAGHAEHVGAGVPRQLVQVVSVLEETHVDTAALRRVAKLLGRGRVRAGAGVDDQESVHQVGPVRPAR